MPDEKELICRFCLETSTLKMEKMCTAQPIPGVPTAEEIWIMLGIKIDPHDGLPKEICVTCLTKINYIKRIRKQFQEADETLHELLEEGSFDSQKSGDTHDEPASSAQPTEITYPTPPNIMTSSDDLQTLYEQPLEPQIACYQDDQLPIAEQTTILFSEEVVDDVGTETMKLGIPNDVASDQGAKSNKLSSINSLYTGRFIDSPTIKIEPCEESSSNLDMRPQKRRCYGRFRLE